jgi:hypothetical protein
LKTQRGSADAIALSAEWQQLKERTTREVALEKHAEWKSCMDQAAADIQSDPKKAWSLMRNVAGWQQRSQIGSQPLKDPDTGELQVDAVNVGRIWREHFALLYDDHTGNSKDPTKWHNKFGPCPPDRYNAMESLNIPFTGEELQWALRRLKNGKAPGLDGIPSEVYKLLSETGTVTPMAAVFLSLLNGVYMTGRIPAGWETSIVVPIFKKGDETETGNYRGIALMSTALKVLCVMLNRRLSDVLHELQLLKPHQAGFLATQSL